MENKHPTQQPTPQELHSRYGIGTENLPPLQPQAERVFLYNPTSAQIQEAVDQGKIVIIANDEDFEHQPGEEEDEGQEEESDSLREQDQPDTTPLEPRYSGPRPRFTFRQREFARHYAMGKPAAQAAIAAGYAASTAETNAARLLSQSTVCRYIDAYRRGCRTVTQGHYELALQRIVAILEDSRSEPTVLRAVAELRKLVKDQQRRQVNWAVEGLYEAELVYPHPDVLAAPQPQEGMGKEQAQTEAQNREPQNPALEVPPETDTLPSGLPAFDVRLQPLKQETAKPIQPLTIEFVPYTKPAPEE